MSLAADDGDNHGGESLNNALSVVAGVRTEPIEVEGSMPVPAKPKLPLQTETSSEYPILLMGAQRDQTE